MTDDGAAARSNARSRVKKRPASKSPNAKSAKATRRGQNEFALTIGQRVQEVAAALGSNAKLAVLPDTAPSQPTRWITGTEQPNSTNARAIVDLDHVVARANLLWQPSVVTAWLYGHNAFLSGARSIDAVKPRDPAPVIEALDQELAGGYA